MVKKADQCDIRGCTNAFKYSVQFSADEVPKGKSLIQHQCADHHSNVYSERVRTRSERGDMLDWYIDRSNRYGLDSLENKRPPRADYISYQEMEEGWERDHPND